MLKSIHLHVVAQRRIKRLFTSGLPVQTRRGLFAELETCPRCAAIYADFHNAEAALCRTHPAGSPFAVERTGEALLADLVSSKSNAPNPSLRWVLSGGAVAIAAALILFLLPTKPSNHRVALGPHDALTPVELMARGGPTGSSDFGIRVFRVEPNEDVSEIGRVFTSSIITFTFSNAKGTAAYFTLFGIQAGGAIRRYYPDYGQNRSIRIEGTRIDEPLGDGIDLSVNHRSGLLRVVALFSNSPIEMKRIEEQVESLPDSAIFSSELDPLFTDVLGQVAAEHSIMVHLESKGH